VKLRCPEGGKDQCVSFTGKTVCIPCKRLNAMPLIEDTLVWEFVQKNGDVSKFNCKSELGYAGTFCGNRFQLAVKIDF
jgi:hypothetical protein